MKKWKILFSLGLILILSSSSAMAIGLGPYFNYDIGNMDLESADSSVDIDADNKRMAIGFLLDTCTSQDSLFNYRLNIGYGISDVEIEGATEGDGTGFDMKHTFGFGLLRNSHVRLWLGPAIKLYADVISLDGTEDDLVTFGFGAGPEVGVNIHTGGLVSIGLTFGLSYNFSLVTGDALNEDYSGSEMMYYFQISPIFNLGGDRNPWKN